MCALCQMCLKTSAVRVLLSFQELLLLLLQWYVLCICGSAKPDMLCFQGKSAVWSHLLSFQEVIECNETSNPIDPKMLTPGGLCHWLFSLGSLCSLASKVNTEKSRLAAA